MRSHEIRVLMQGTQRSAAWRFRPRTAFGVLYLVTSMQKILRLRKLRTLRICGPSLGLLMRLCRLLVETPKLTPSTGGEACQNNGDEVPELPAVDHNHGQGQEGFAVA